MVEAKKKILRMNTLGRRPGQNRHHPARVSMLAPLSFLHC
jgi:hypothetical protein